MNNIIKWLFIICGVVFIIFVLIGADENKIEKNRCVRILINEDEIASGCDKYFQNDKWYKDFMEQMYKEYNKIK